MGLVLHKGQVIFIDLNIWKHDIDWIFVNFLLKFIFGIHLSNEWCCDVLVLNTSNQNVIINNNLHFSHDEFGTL
jgi:hypothetical protein